MLTEKHFKMMKRDAIFVNTGRGPTVDEAALIKALQQGWIAGAGLDVLEDRAAEAGQSAPQNGQCDPDSRMWLPLRRGSILRASAG